MSLPEWGKTALILAAGQQFRWPGLSAKQLADVAGEPAIFRLIRQARARGWNPVVITRRNYLPELPCPVVIIEPTPSLCHTLLAIPPDIMKTVGLILVGDAVMSKATADESMRRTRGVQFIRNGHETLALRVEDIEYLMQGVSLAVKRNPSQDLRLRDVMSVLSGFRDPGYRESYCLDTEVTDWSIDIDDEVRYKHILRIIECGLMDDLPNGI